MPKNDIAIDLGTTNTLVYVESKGVILNEPSVVVVDAETKEIRAIGADAKTMLGRTHRGIRIVKPLEYGVISDYAVAADMLRFFAQKAMKKCGSRKPRAVICIPSGISNVERKVVIETAHNIGLRRLGIVEESMAAAVGAGLDTDAASGCMVIDIGGGTCEISVISLGGIVVSKTIRIGGNSFDESIKNYIRKKFSVVVGECSCELVKKKVGTVLRSDGGNIEQICGRSTLSGMPCSISVSSEDIRRAVMPGIRQIIDAVKFVLERTPPELSSDILTTGIVLTGGGALIHGLDRLICFETGIPVSVADAPLECVVRGAGGFVSKRDKFDKIRMK